MVIMSYHLSTKSEDNHKLYNKMYNEYIQNSNSKDERQLNMNYINI